MRYRADYSTLLDLFIRPSGERLPTDVRGMSRSVPHRRRGATGGGWRSNADRKWRCFRHLRILVCTILVCRVVNGHTHPGVEPKRFRFLRDLMGGTRDFLGRATMRYKQRKRRNHLGLQALSFARRFLIGVVQIHSPRPKFSSLHGVRK